MIQAGQVRIGNIVRYFAPTGDGKQENRDVPVERIKLWSGFEHVQVDGNYKPLNTVYAVGLSDGWLERLGFEYLTSTYGVRDIEKTYTKYAKLYPGITIEIVKDQDNRHFRFIQLGDHAHGLEDVPLFFVHQLQNLCFDLIGVELMEEKPIKAR